jgi:hypothetical protein
MPAESLSANLRVRGVHRPRRAPEDLRAPVQLDRRTKLGRAAESFRLGLVRHVGGHPSATQAALIAQAVQLQLRLLVMDQSFAERGGQSAHEARQYLAWANCQARLLGRLGLKATAAPATSLADILAATAKPSNAAAPGVGLAPDAAATAGGRAAPGAASAPLAAILAAPDGGSAA